MFCQGAASSGFWYSSSSDKKHVYTKYHPFLYFMLKSSDMFIEFLINVGVSCPVTYKSLDIVIFYTCDIHVKCN